jgi:hypothetical protein
MWRNDTGGDICAVGGEERYYRRCEEETYAETERRMERDDEKEHGQASELDGIAYF